jgi:hypothetical protein
MVNVAGSSQLSKYSQWTASSSLMDSIVKSATDQEDVMAKGQKRSNREKKKPKQDRPKPVAVNSPFLAGRANPRKAESK